MYNTGFAAHPAVIHLRPGESFTRTLDPDGFGGPNRRRFWHIAKNGPTRNWAFVDEKTPGTKAPKATPWATPALAMACLSTVRI